MQRFTWLTKWQVLGLIGLLALGMVAATIIAGVLVSNQASAHGGDASLVHACVNQTNAEVRIAHPGPGNENTDCTALGVDWMNVHLDDEWLGAGTGSLSPANLTDNVGIGTASPQKQLHVVVTSQTLPSQRGIRTSLGAVEVNLVADINEGFVGTTSDHDFRIVTNSSIRMVITKDGNVGIGTLFPSEKLTVQGNALADAHTTPSSKRWKTNINTIDDALDTIQQLRGVTYDWKVDGRHDIGLIAEEVGEVLPEIVQYEDNGVDARSLDYARLVPLLIEAVKEQQREIETLKTIVATRLGDGIYPVK